MSTWSSSTCSPLQHGVSLGQRFPGPLAKQGCNPIYKVRQAQDCLCKYSLCSLLPVLGCCMRSHGIGLIQGSGSTIA